jgi:3-hydroxybutyryl-CoA dehydrogenase
MSSHILPDTSRPTAVIGSGTLGQRIALMLASAGGEVRLYDPNPQQAEAGRLYIERELENVVAARQGATAGRVRVATSLEDALTEVWMVVEAVPERLDLKIKLFGDLDRLAPADAVLASNSSSYPSSQFIAEVTRPERVVNTHYYMPPEQAAVEIMSCGKTDDAIIALLMERLPACGLVPFQVRTESVGFIFNRIWAAVKREALAVVAEGASTPEDVDRIAHVLTGAPGGPFRMMDKVGLDVVLDIEEHYAETRSGVPSGPRELLRKYIDEGRLGVKSGRGFYSDYR